MPENTHAYTAKEALVIFINHFLTRQEQIESNKDYDSAMEVTRERFRERVAQLQDPLKSIASQLFEVSDQAHFVFKVLRWKIYYLAQGLQHAVESENPMSLANNTRSLLEHIATISTLGQGIQKLESILAGQQSEKKITDAINDTLAHIQKTYYGVSPKSSTQNQIAGIHVNDSLKDLKKEIENIDELYDFLCEFVHPNYGSNQLVSSGQLASGHLKPSEDYNRELLDQLRRICSYSFVYLEENLTGHFSAPARLQLFLELCFHPGAKLTTVFARRLPQPAGDGRTKESAYFFPKARNSMEAGKMTVQFFEVEGIELTGPKHIGGIENGFIFEKYSTNQGEVWVKMPMPTL